MGNHQSVRQSLSDTMKLKWKDATDGPPYVLKEVLEGGDSDFRGKLLTAQGECPELKPLIAAARLVLRASSRDSTVEALKVTKDYKLALDGVLERSVHMSRVFLWVPVMPTTVIPMPDVGERKQDLTWRRYAFERAHMTFLEPHRPAGASFQALKRCLLYTSPSPRD